MRSLQVLAYCFTVFTTLASQLSSEESITISNLCVKMSNAVLNNRHEEVVDMMYPEIVEQIGGKDKYVELLHAEEQSNRAAGIKVHSHSLSTHKDYFDGSKFRVVFVGSEMVLDANGSKWKSTSYQIAFRELTSSRWYLIDGTKINMTQFRNAFKGLPDDIQLPKVSREKI